MLDLYIQSDTIFFWSYLNCKIGNLWEFVLTSGFKPFKYLKTELYLISKKKCKRRGSICFINLNINISVTNVVYVFATYSQTQAHHWYLLNSFSLGYISYRNELCQHTINKYEIHPWCHNEKCSSNRQTWRTNAAVFSKF